MRIAFLFAHPDDEAFGPSGTIKKLSENNQVMVMSLCNGRRPGSNNDVYERRGDAFQKSCDMLGADSMIWNTDDCSLEYRSVVEHVQRIVDYYRPDVVYTHSINDLHMDHRLVAEGCLISSRPKPNSCINALYYSEVVPSTAWGMGQLGSFAPNVYSDITDVIHTKRDVLELYDTELYEYPDARSVENVLNVASVRGSHIGVNYAEAFQLVFSHDRKS